MVVKWNKNYLDSNLEEVHMTANENKNLIDAALGLEISIIGAWISLVRYTYYISFLPIMPHIVAMIRRAL